MISECFENRWGPAHRIMASTGIILLPWKNLKLKWRNNEFSTKNSKNAKKQKVVEMGPKLARMTLKGPQQHAPKLRPKYQVLMCLSPLSVPGASPLLSSISLGLPLVCAGQTDSTFESDVSSSFAAPDLWFLFQASSLSVCWPFLTMPPYFLQFPAQVVQ